MESVLGGMDGAVLERLAKIMGYMRVAPGAKPGKRLKKRDKQRMLEGGVVPSGSSGGALAANGTAVGRNGQAAVADGGAPPGAMPPPPKPTAADDEVRWCLSRLAATCTECLTTIA